MKWGKCESYNFCDQSNRNCYLFIHQNTSNDRAITYTKLHLFKKQKNIQFSETQIMIFNFDILFFSQLQASCSRASSILSIAMSKNANIKENKEKKNREKLLAGPGSEFSLANPEDLEMDYYDYNVINSAAAPGSYLGMDPAYLIWIPPIDGDQDSRQYFDGEEDYSDPNDSHYEEISPDHQSPRSSSTSGTPIDEPPKLPPLNKNMSQTIESHEYINNIDYDKMNTINKNIDKDKQKSTSSVLDETKNSIESIPLKVLKINTTIISQQSPLSPVKVHRVGRNHICDKNDNDTEKETAVVKSPSYNIKEYYELDDIQFVDDDDVEGEDIYSKPN